MPHGSGEEGWIPGQACAARRLDHAAVAIAGEQLQGRPTQAVAGTLAAQELALRLDRQVGDADDVAGDQDVDHVFDHPS